MYNSKIFNVFSRYDCINISAVETAVFIAPDADNLGLHWAVVDSDVCPWPETYNDDDYGDLLRQRPYLDVAQRPNASSTKKPKAEDEFTDEDESADEGSSGSSSSGSDSDETDSDSANDHSDADEDGVNIASLASEP